MNQRKRFSLPLEVDKEATKGNFKEVKEDRLSKYTLNMK